MFKYHGLTATFILLLFSCKSDFDPVILSDLTDGSTRELVVQNLVRFDASSSPSQLGDALASSDITIFGETHYTQEHQEFIVRMLPTLSQLGYRVIFDELFHSVGWIVEDYIAGHIEDVPEFIRFFHHELIEGIKDFNASVPDSLQFRLVYFDLNHWSQNFVHSLEIMEQQIGQQALFAEIFNETLDSPGYASALNGMEVAMESEEVFYRNDMGSKWYDRLLDMIRVEKASYEFRSNRDHLSREILMFENISQVFDAAPDKKYLVNTGMTHGQKETHMSIDIPRIGATLSGLTEQIFSIAFIGIEGERKRRFYDENVIAFNLIESSRNSDMIKYIGEEAGGQLSYLPLSDAHFSNSIQRISFSAGTTILAPVGRQFDALICYPSISVLYSMDEFDWN
ncbi:MAG: hypothetical protein AAF741_16830 [Bacteroidota bacterium]